MLEVEPLVNYLNMFLPNKSKPHIIRAATAATTSYVAGTVVSVDEANMIGIQATIVKGNETSFEFKVESSIDGGTTWAQQITESASGGTVTLTPAIYTLTGASLAATQVFTFIVSPVKADQIRVSVKSTGGTPTGTVAIEAITGWV